MLSAKPISTFIVGMSGKKAHHVHKIFDYNTSGKVKLELRVQIHELRVQIYKLLVQIYESSSPQVTSSNIRVRTLKAQVVRLKLELGD